MVGKNEVNRNSLIIPIIFFLGCTKPEPHIVVDTSGSIPETLRPKIDVNVRDEVIEFAEQAGSGKEITVWWLTPGGSTYATEYAVFKMPRLEFPANLNRTGAIDEMKMKVDRTLLELPRDVKATKLLEALFLIGSVQHEPWSITILSDLRQESRTWRRLSQGKTEEELVEVMMNMAGTPVVRPSAVTLATYPGLSPKGQEMAMVEHIQNRDLFVKFLEQWAPGVKPKLKTIQ